MKYAHLIQAKVFSYEKDYDDEKQIFEKIQQLFPFNFEDEKLQVTKTSAFGFNKKKIAVLEIILQKERHTSKFLESLANKLDVRQKRIILTQAESRLDNNLDFFLRFDKGELVKHDKLVLTDSGKCFHIRISLAAFPKKRQNALEIISKIFAQ